MAVFYAQNICQARLKVVLDALGAGSKLVIGTVALSGVTEITRGVLATVPLPNPAGSIAGKTLTFAGLPRIVIADSGGPAALAELRDKANKVVVSSLTVGLAGSIADIIIGPVLAIQRGAEVTLLEAAIIHA